MGVEGFGQGLGWAVSWQVLIYSFSLYCWENSLLSNASSNTIESMQLGDSTATTREPRSRLDEALDTFETASPS